MSLLKEISITDLSNLRIGHASDYNAQTGVTVLYFPLGAKVGCDISGGGPASRETPLTSPVTADNPINAIVLSGGSAYGLAAADGVMNYLESQNIGYNTGAALVPLVCQSCIYDLSYGDPKIRPTAKMGEEACRQAFAGTDTRTGNIGAGTRCNCGKTLRYETIHEVRSWYCRCICEKFPDGCNCRCQCTGRYLQSTKWSENCRAENT